MARYGDLDYGRFTKGGFGLGIALFALGIAGSMVVPSVFGTVPGWESGLFVDSEAVGIVVAFLSVLLFGIALPLTE